MEEILLINPRRRKSAAKKGRKHRTAAQKAATRKLVALNRARRSGSTSAPARKRRARRAAPAVYATNPIRRHRRRVHRATTRRHTYRRNPSAPRVNLMSLLKNGAMGGMGAVAVNTAYNWIPLPAMLKTGNMSYIARAALAVGLGLFGRKIMPGNMAARMAEGSLAVTFHDAITNIVSPMVPGMKLGGYDSSMGFIPGGAALPGHMPMMTNPALQMMRHNAQGMASEYINSPSGIESMGEMGEYIGMSGLGEYVM